MKIALLTVGKTDRDWVRQGLDIYVSRLKHYIPFSIIEIPELKNVSALSKDQIKTREGELILKNIKPTDEVILLDEHGKEYSSIEFAKIIQDRISYGGKDMVFVIGGAKDQVVSGGASVELAEKLGCKLHMYDSLGHAAYEEAKDFNSRVMNFLK